MDGVLLAAACPFQDLLSATFIVAVENDWNNRFAGGVLSSTVIKCK
jgi:hypothetical protein